MTLIKLTSVNDFKNNFSNTDSDHVRWQTTPLQIYPLHYISNYLTLPTALSQPDFNYLIH